MSLPERHEVGRKNRLGGALGRIALFRARPISRQSANAAGWPSSPVKRAKSTEAERAERAVRRAAEIDRKVAALPDVEAMRAARLKRREKSMNAFKERLKKAPTPQSRLKSKSKGKRTHPRAE